MMDVVRNSQKRSGHEYEKNVRGDSKMFCGCCRFRCGWCFDERIRVSYSIMHRRLTTAGREVAPHYHQFASTWLWNEQSLAQRWFWFTSFVYKTYLYQVYSYGTRAKTMRRSNCKAMSGLKLHATLLTLTSLSLGYWVLLGSMEASWSNTLRCGPAPIPYLGMIL